MKITDVMANIIGPGGLASSNRYQISFQFTENSQLSAAVGINGTVQEPQLYETGSINSDSAKISYLADEVNIPGFSISTGDFEGHMPGMNQKYAHTKTYRDFTITFLMDQQHLPFKMLHKWTDFIFLPQPGTVTDDIDERSYIITNYYNDYTCNMVIDKLEIKPSEKDPLKKSVPKSSIYLYNVFPYLINDITVSNGPNQPLKFQASFYFEYSKAVTRSDGLNPSTASDTRLSLNFLNNGVFNLGSQNIG